MAKIKREQLVAAAKDLNKVLGLEPPINTNTTKEKELVTALSEVVDLIDETDEIKDSTREVLVQLGFIQSDVEDEVEDDVEDVEDDEFEEQEEEEGIEDITPTPPTLEELKDLIAESSSIKELKELMKHELLTEFTPSAEVKNVIDLRTAMLDFLEKEEVEEVKEVAEKVTEKIAIKKKESKKNISNKGAIYLAWEKGEVNIEILSKLVNQAVKDTTIKGWINSWKRGTNLPAISK